MAILTMPERAVLVVDGVSVATRTVGSRRRLVLLHRFRGTLDGWDPAFVSALATAGHEVFMFDSVGVGETGGVTSSTGRREPQADSEGVMNTVRAGIDPEGLRFFRSCSISSSSSRQPSNSSFRRTRQTNRG